MMKQLGMSVGVLVCLVAGALGVYDWVQRPGGPKIPGMVVLHAQTLPITKTLVWDSNPAGDAVTNYVVRLDNVVIGSPTVPSQSFVITTLGSHTLSVVAVNLWAESAPTVLTVNVVGPGRPANLRIQ